MNVVCKIVKLHNQAVIPEKATFGSAGFDLTACEKITIEPGKTGIVGTGVTIEVPFGYEGQVRSRSGLAAKNGVFVLNSPGTIDSDYRGELRVILHNAGSNEFNVIPGMRIAQFVVQPCVVTTFVCVTENELSSTERDKGGLGSTGLH